MSRSKYQRPVYNGDWQHDFAQWKEWAQAVSDLVRRVNDARLDRAYRLAATVGIPRNGCCLHNASIDDEMRGWCHNNPLRLKVAKKAAWIANQWTPEPKAVSAHFPRGQS